MRPITPTIDPEPPREREGGGQSGIDCSCVWACPVPGAIFLNRQAKDAVDFKRIETGEDFFA
jgi:hypothetical protein